MMRFKVVLRRDKEDGGYVALCPALPGCASQGATKKEALANIREAVEGVVTVLNRRARKSSSSDQLAHIEF